MKKMITRNMGEMRDMDQRNNQAKITAENKLYRLPINEVIEALDTNLVGLSQAQAHERMKIYGKNALVKKKGKPMIVKFLSNFTHLMAILLWCAGVVGFVAGLPELAIAIWMVNLINGAFSFWQEFRAGKATEALEKMLPDYAHVLRDGEEMRILAEELVPGDIMILSEGDRISADARLIEENDLRVNQSALTGESHPVDKCKDALDGDELSRSECPNLVFAGTTVGSGNGKAVVYATGMNSEFGKIADLTQTVKEETSPLQKEMGRLTKTISIMAVSVGVVFFVLSISLVGMSIPLAFISAMGMIVAFIPEGLLPTVTLSLAMGVRRMAKRNALIKRLSAVETLGCATVICTDKTGTLTQNEMTVNHIWMPGQSLDVSGTGYDATTGQIHDDGRPVRAHENAALSDFITAAALCCDARLTPPKDASSRPTVIGDPTEAAILVLAQKAGLVLSELSDRYPRLRELSFDSSRKRMSTVHQAEHGRVLNLKGAPKEVLDLCAYVRIGGMDVAMTEDMYQEAMDMNDQYARNGLRVLAIATKSIPCEALPEHLEDCTAAHVENGLTLLGLIAMVDPPRPEVAKAVSKCHQAGIRIIMITGDYGLTAESIARKIGIVKGRHPRVITGVELEKMTTDNLIHALRDEVIFARVAPEQKLQVVSALQEMGHVVAVTGDGVNDAPALKKADIGVAMGISGTDVAKEAADMILMDDNFASIVNAIEEGRAVYNNIRKFAVYILNSNMAEAIPVVLYLFSRGSIPLPLTIMQVLAIDLGTDMVPAMGLGTEAPEEGMMNVPPRSQKEPLLNGVLLRRAMLWYGLMEAALGMGAYFFVSWMGGWPEVPLASEGIAYRSATTMTLAGIVLAQVGAAFACRTNRASLFEVGLFSNRMVLVGIGVELMVLCALAYVPALQSLFHTGPIDLRSWGVLIWIPVIVLALDEGRKAIARRREGRVPRMEQSERA